jgi:predicted Zn-dependent peptidase
MPQNLYQHQLENGMVLIAEPMPNLRSASICLTVPAGTMHEPQGFQGLASICCDMIQRGAGEYDSHEIIEQLDCLGVERDDGVSTYHVSFHASMIADVLPDVLEIYSKIVREPRIPEEDIEHSKAGAIQELRGLEDELAQRCFRDLKRIRYPGPLGRSPLGDFAGIEAIDRQALLNYHSKFYIPQGTILSVAGAIDWQNLVELTEALFGHWGRGSAHRLPKPEVVSAYKHIVYPSQQTQIALAYDGVPYGHPDYYRARALVGILSDGLSSRLFTKVREENSLVYAVSASPHSLYGCGSNLCYAGTQTQKAQKCFDLVWQTILSLRDGIAQEELDCWKARMRTSLVMEQESSLGRASQMASDWFYLGRIVPLDETQLEIQNLTTDSLQQYSVENPPQNFTVVTLGEMELELPDGISASKIE